MSQVAQDLPKKELPERVRRELRKGESIYHSAMACHVSAKFPDGKWIGQVRREERGTLVKYPVKGFGSPKDALDYIKSLRPDGLGRVHAVRQGEPTVAELYEFVSSQRQKRMGEQTKEAKRGRWRLHIEPEWGNVPVSKVTKRAAQEWITEVEEKIEAGSAGTLGLAQFEKVRKDLHALFENVGSFSPVYEDRKNPFSDLDFTAQPPRAKVTIESQHFSAIVNACQKLSAEGLCTDWIAKMFLTSLLSGLREGEVMVLCRDQIDFKNGAILVDRAMRRKSRAIDPKTRLEVGGILPQAVNLPKGGVPGRDKSRVVPISDQLADILRPIYKEAGETGTAWDFLWASAAGTIRQQARFRTAWSTLRERLNEVATLAPLMKPETGWPEMPKRQGWPRNPLILEARKNSAMRLPDVFADIDFRDTRNSFASYMNEVGIPQATREEVLGHGGGGLTNTVYTVVTNLAFQDARNRLSHGWAKS